MDKTILIPTYCSIELTYKLNEAHYPCLFSIITLLDAIKKGTIGFDFFKNQVYIDHGLPTYTDVLKYFRESKKIALVPYPKHDDHISIGKWVYAIYVENVAVWYSDNDVVYDSYEDACEAGISSICDYLIKSNR